MEVIIYIYYSNNKRIKKDTYYKVILKKKIGEGSYGYIYEINDTTVVKIFKNYTYLDKVETKNNIIPHKNENRELHFFINYIKNNILTSSHIIEIHGIGLIKSTTFNKIKFENHYCLFLPYCVPISKLLHQYKMPFIKLNYGKILTMHFMKRLIEIELYLNKEFKITNLDIKLDNCMIEKGKQLKIDNIIGIDLGLIKKKNQEKYYFKTHYFIWPYKKEVKLDYIPSYSICINGLILLFGKNENVQIKDINQHLNELKGDKELYHIFYNGLLLKIKSKDLYILINNYIKKYEHKK